MSQTESCAKASQPQANHSLDRPSITSTGRWSETIRRVFSFPVLLGVLVVSMVFGIGRNGLSDPDMWWHLRNAESLLTNQRFIRFDSYSFTVNGHPWINPEWLGEVPYYLVWHSMGLGGVKGLSLMLLGCIFLGLLYLCWRESGNIKASAIACCFSVLLGAVSFGPRTVLFGYLYLVLLLVLLERFRTQGRGPMWVLPPLFCLWINTHGSWSLGIIVFGIVIAAGLLEGRWRGVEATRWTSSQLRKLLLVLGGSIVALFINPYGYRLVRYPVDMAFHQKLNISHVAEWVSVDFHDVRGKVVLILIAGLVLGALLSGYRWKLHELGMVFFGLYCGLTYIRFLFLAAILIAPLLAKFLDFVPPYRREIDKPALNALIIAAVLVSMIHWFPSDTQLRQSIDREYPAEVLPFLKSHPPSDRVLNFYLWGGYLGWEDRTFKCFVDSRVDIFEYAGVFKDYIDLLGLKEPESILDKYAIRYVLFPPDEPLSFVLSRDPNWKVIFKGTMSMMFERVGAVPHVKAAGVTRVEESPAW